MLPERRNSISVPDAEGSYWASVSDLMIGMLFIFIILLMVFGLIYRVAEQRKNEEIANLHQEKLNLSREADKLRHSTDASQQEKIRLEGITEKLINNDKLRRHMLSELQIAMQKYGISILVDAENGILRLPEDMLFDSGQADFRPEGKQAIERLAESLAQILPCYSPSPSSQAISCSKEQEARLEAVLIEGHTDNVPIRGRFPDNWSLASARALNTYKALIAHIPLLDQLQNPKSQPVLSVSAYEARRPVGDNQTEDGKRSNRRIDLRFLMATPRLDEIQTIKDQLK